MKLKFQENIDKIKNCPSQNEKGEMNLFRCVESEISEKSFVPQAVLLKPKYQDMCIAWGISVFNSFDSANQMLKNLSKNKRNNYSKIARGIINDSHGIKHGGNNKKHYTFFPTEEFNILENFEVVNRND
ncbi:hypothetical protein [Leeuwenhoekiella nanhaiensis]|uniref:Uncharacterized protein n=1 Tax=Leeuwenhoekiella nanhaiensis TaxID=1655491 RepID=A0A2G1VWN8_9FLAO|nr:hypothetical protein [Leeuwenhoekiella nanhaiensis]PHQ30839.1 hypothetical protein CJ305_01005 [Leeuwenhoekiella nanhaiensis]